MCLCCRGQKTWCRACKKVVDPTSGQETWVPEEPIQQPLHTVYRYRPRTEGLFARIERWVHNTTNEMHWRTITRDNVTSIYGGTAASRLADPDNAQRVYEWLLHETFDATGNHILYEYAKDDPQLYTDDDPDVRLPEIFEQHRAATQLYIRRIYYGNLPEPLVDAQGHPVTYADGTAVGHLRDGRRYAFEGHCQVNEKSLSDAFPLRKAEGVGIAKIQGLVKAQNPL